jgi:hypothetical protein
MMKKFSFVSAALGIAFFTISTNVNAMRIDELDEQKEIHVQLKAVNI